MDLFRKETKFGATDLHLILHTTKKLCGMWPIKQWPKKKDSRIQSLIFFLVHTEQTTSGAFYRLWNIGRQLFRSIEWIKKGMAAKREGLWSTTVKGSAPWTWTTRWPKHGDYYRGEILIFACVKPYTNTLTDFNFSNRISRPKLDVLTHLVNCCYPLLASDNSHKLFGL